MLDKEKLYIIAYINIANIDNTHVSNYMNEITKHLTKGFDDSVKFFVIPIRNGESNIQFFNINMLKDLEPDNIETLIEKLKSLKEGFSKEIF